MAWITLIRTPEDELRHRETQGARRATTGSRMLTGD